MTHIILCYYDSYRAASYSDSKMSEPIKYGAQHYEKHLIPKDVSYCIETTLFTQLHIPDEPVDTHRHTTCGVHALISGT